MRTLENHRLDILMVVVVLENETRVQRNPLYTLNHVPMWDASLRLPLESRTPSKV